MSPGTIPRTPHPWHQIWEVCPLSFPASLPTAADAPAKLTRNRRNPGRSANPGPALRAGRRWPQRTLFIFQIRRAPTHTPGDPATPKHRQPPDRAAAH